VRTAEEWWDDLRRTSPEVHEFAMVHRTSVQYWIKRIQADALDAAAGKCDKMAALSRECIDRQAGDPHELQAEQGALDTAEALAIVIRALKGER